MKKIALVFSLLCFAMIATASAVEFSADMVTEMREIKHPFKKGIKAQKGIEF